jgi:hypothetical protein
MCGVIVISAVTCGICAASQYVLLLSVIGRAIKLREMKWMAKTVVCMGKMSTKF